MLQFFRMGLKWEAASASLGGNGLMVERINARQSATFLFGAQARAGVWPDEDQQVRKLGLLWWSPSEMNILTYRPRLQPWLLLLCSATPAQQWPGLFLQQYEEACRTNRFYSFIRKCIYIVMADILMKGFFWRRHAGVVLRALQQLTSGGSCFLRWWGRSLWFPQGATEHTSHDPADRSTTSLNNGA